jgi:hypothetical protein
MDTGHRNLDDALNCIRRAPLATLDDVKALLAACVSRVADFDRASLGCDLSAVIDELSDAEHQLEVATQWSADPVDAARSVEELRSAA